jgi:acetoacetyl-CoA synthetase
VTTHDLAAGEPGRVLWQPSPAEVASARITAFREQVNRRFGRELDDFDGLWRWSVENRTDFWEAVWRFCGVQATREWDEVLVDGERMPGARWFVGARLNYAENLLGTRGAADAIVFRGEGVAARRLSWDTLRALVARTARALRAAGVSPGDRVAGLLPNVPEAVVAMLGAASVGAVWSSCSPDFGVSGVCDRFGQIEPRVLFTADGYVYAGRRYELLERVSDLLEQLPSIRRTVVLAHLDERPDVSRLRGAQLLDDFLAPHGEDEIAFEPLPFDHPLCVVYSSGTTGLPKCIVHGAGGTLLQHLKEHALHCDFRAGERAFYYTTCGWMMWNWLVSALATGTTILLFDGAPQAPQGALWEYLAEEKAQHFGTSARYLAAAEKAGLIPGATYALGALRSILSTGSPLLPESFDWVYREVKRDVRLSSISGGTDILSCFVLGSPDLPVRRGEIQCRGLGMRVEVRDDDGRPLVGRKGELVCSAPFPSMPVAFWNDPDGARYRQTYFSRWPGVWCHGDYAELLPSGGMRIFGRSDATLNPGGVRIGTAEIYRVVESFTEVSECLAVGQEWRGDVRIVLFLRLRDGLSLDEDLRLRIKAAIRAEETPRHVPAKIVQVAALPRTISGKLVELAVRDVIHGRAVPNRDALQNPEALDLFRELPELHAD